MTQARLNRPNAGRAGLRLHFFRSSRKIHSETVVWYDKHNRTFGQPLLPRRKKDFAAGKKSGRFSGWQTRHIRENRSLPADSGTIGIALSFRRPPENESHPEHYIRSHFRDILTHASAVEKRIDDSGCTPDEVIRDNALAPEECRAQNLPYIFNLYR